MCRATQLMPVPKLDLHTSVLDVQDNDLHSPHNYEVEHFDYSNEKTLSQTRQTLLRNSPCIATGTLYEDFTEGSETSSGECSSASFHDFESDFEDEESIRGNNIDSNDINNADNDLPLNNDLRALDFLNVPNLDEFRPYDQSLSERLCNCTTINRGEAILMCMVLSRRHSLTWEATIDFLKMINVLFDKEDAVPNTKYQLSKFFPMGEGTMKYHFYCPNCKKYLAMRSNAKAVEKISCTCGYTVHETDTSCFLSLDFCSQLKNLLESPDVKQNLNKRYERVKDDIDSVEDIYDGKMYKKLCIPDKPLSHQWNFSYTFNTDGCQAANSSRVSIWPIYATLNELPFEMRAKNMLLMGLWVDKHEPDMQLFLQPFVEEANCLSTHGLQWQYDENTVITSRIIPCCCSVDSVARPSMLNMKQYNGKYGCTFCEHPTEAVDGYRKYPISTFVPPDRTDESIKQNMVLAHTGTESVKGIKGPSALMNLNYFDLANGMVPDYMHSVLLGVTKQYTEIILSSSEKDFYVGNPNQLDIINNRLLSITLPKCITRTPRSLHERRLWKASEWRSWLVWYSLLCLRDVIPRKYLEHLSMLICGIHILLQKSILPEMIERAKIMLIKFVTLCQKYFGKQFMTYNVHLLLHLTKSVENWGPLWVQNSFCFENENRLLLQMKKSPTHVALQISRRFLFGTSLTAFRKNIRISAKVNKFCSNLYKTELKFSSNTQNCILVGSGKQYMYASSRRSRVPGVRRGKL